MKFSLARDILVFQTDFQVKKPFFSEKKGLEDSEWDDKKNDYTKWKSFEHLIKTYSSIHKEFKNLWKWVEKTYPWTFPDNKLLIQFKTVDAQNLLCLLYYEQTAELERWKDCLKSGKLYVFPSEKEMHVVVTK